MCCSRTPENCPLSLGPPAPLLPCREPGQGPRGRKLGRQAHAPCVSGQQAAPEALCCCFLLLQEVPGDAPGIVCLGLGSSKDHRQPGLPVGGRGHRCPGPSHQGAAPAPISCPRGLAGTSSQGLQRDPAQSSSRKGRRGVPLTARPPPCPLLGGWASPTSALWLWVSGSPAPPRQTGR